MELYESSRRESRRTWALALTLLVAIFIAGAPVVQAAVQAVRVTNTPSVKIKDTGNGRIDSDEIGSGSDAGTLGLFNAPGSKGAVSTRTFGGGGGLLGEGDCYDATSRPATATVAPDAQGHDRIVTAIILTGSDAVVTVDAPGLPGSLGVDVIKFRATPESPNVFVGLGNGLTVEPSPLVFTCDGTNGEFVILGQ